MKKLITICAVVMMVSSMVSAADVAGWETFVIRNSNVGNIAPTISDDISGGKLFGITLAGQKAGWGTDIMNGKTIGDIQAISIIRHPATTGAGPYMNFWVTDGIGGYAILAVAGNVYDTTWDNLKTLTAFVYEVGTGFKMPDSTIVSGGGLAGTDTFNAFAGYTIATSSSHWGGTGAPDDLNASSYTAYGVNWVFGDTQDNYLGGYLVSNPTVVPEPTTICLLGIGALSLIRRKK